MFAKDNGRKARIGDYDTMFRNLLEQGQKIHPDLFTTGVFIGDFVPRRIPWSGSATEEENNNVETAVIEVINMRRKKEEARGTEAGLYIRQVYT